MENLTHSQPPVTNPLRMGELRSQSSKLEQIVGKLRERDRAIFGMCEDAVKRSDTSRAKIYANEMVRIRGLIKTITQSQLAIECIVIRLENFIELHSLIADLKPLSKMIQSLSGHVSRVMPEIASEMEQLNVLVSDTLTETSVDLSQPIIDPALIATTPDSEEILREVSREIEQKLMVNLPEPPSPMVAPNAPMTVSSKMLVEAIPVSYGSISAINQRNKSSVSKVGQSGEVNYVMDDFLQVIDDLSSKTRAKLEECMA